MNKTLSGRLQELKNKRIVQLGNSKSGRGRLREWSLTRVVARGASTVMVSYVHEKKTCLQLLLAQPHNGLFGCIGHV